MNWPHRVKLVSGAVAVAVAAAGLYAADRALGHAARVHLAACREHLQQLRDAILRFQLDRERFPSDLAELAPGYIPDEMRRFPVGPGGRAAEFVRWNPKTGMLSASAPFRIPGLLPHRVELQLWIRHLRVVHDPVSGQNVFRTALTQTNLAPHDIVVEAERFQFMTYGWEIGEAEDASGQCYLHLKEGVGDVARDGKEFDPAVRSGDFYNISRDMRRIEAQCWFVAPREGVYYLAGRTMAHRNCCSNYIQVRVNEEEFQDLGRNNTRPFVWLWHSLGPVKLRKGANVISLFTLQDDVKIDQFVFTAKDLRLKEDAPQTFVGGCQARPALPAACAPVLLSLSCNTRTIRTDRDPAVSAYLHQNLPTATSFVLRTTLDLPGGRARERSLPIELTPADVLSRFPCPLNLPRPLDRREYLLRCHLLAEERVVQERTAVLFYGYDWSILGPLPFMEVSARCQPEQDDRPRPEYTFAGKTCRWQPYSETNTEQFCLLDFGMMFSGQTFFAMPNVSLYGYTEVEAKTEGPYLLKAQGDDNLIAWINGREVVRITRYGETAIRNAREVPIRLKAGRNRILFRLNQVDRQWQAGFRIRTPDDKVADVVGIPFEQQDVDFTRPSPPRTDSPNTR